MKTGIILIICAYNFLIFSSCSDNKKKVPAEEQKTAVTEEPAAEVITDKHIKIPNSNLYIIPPTGFVVNESIGNVGRGEEYANFIYMKIISGYTPEKFFGELKTQADKDFPDSWKQEEIIADGHKAILYHYKNAAVQQHYLVFTDGYSDEMIVANFLDSETITGKEMYEAMKTVVFKNN